MTSKYAVEIASHTAFPVRNLMYLLWSIELISHPFTTACQQPALRNK
jgi:hypothetical protein